MALVQAPHLAEGGAGAGLAVGDGLKGQIGQHEPGRLVAVAGPLLSPGGHFLGDGPGRPAELAAVPKLPPGPVGIATWLAEQPKWIPLRIVPVGSLARLYPMSFEIVGRPPGSLWTRGSSKAGPPTMASARANRWATSAAAYDS